jgi:hypothetical protein
MYQMVVKRLLLCPSRQNLNKIWILTGYSILTGVNITTVVDVQHVVDRRYKAEAHSKYVGKVPAARKIQLGETYELVHLLKQEVHTRYYNDEERYDTRLFLRFFWLKASPFGFVERAVVGPEEEGP